MGSALSSCLEKVVFTFILGAVAFVMLGAITSGNTEAAGMDGCGINSDFPAQIRKWCPLINIEAERNGIDPDLVAALIYVESNGDPSAISHSGAVGLMQVMPRDGKAAEFRCKNGPCFASRPSTAELRDPGFNVVYGVKMLESLVTHYNGNMREALRAYGPMDVGYHYADTVLAIYQRYGAQP